MITIRQTTDLDLIAQLERAIFVPSDHMTAVARARSTWWIARKDGVPVAYAGARPCKSDTRGAYLSACGVLPDARGLGLQRRLIRARVAWARKQGKAYAITYTLPCNAPSSNNLIRCGFTTYAATWIRGHVVYWYRKLAP